MLAYTPGKILKKTHRFLQGKGLLLYLTTIVYHFRPLCRRTCGWSAERAMPVR
jgi:hypothetical protein